MRKHLLLTFFICYLLSGFSARASHIMGGDFSYKSLGNNKYYVLLTLYRDCAGIPLTGTQSVDVTSASCNGGYDTTYTFSPVNTCPEVTPVTPGCPYSSTCNGGSQPGVDGCQFAAVITLRVPCNDWVVSWTSCCRNAAITNLVNGSLGGLSFYLYCIIDNLNGLAASSPILTTLPTPYICPNKPVYYSQGGYDPDGDSLQFNLAPPLGTALNDSNPYISGLSSHNPFNTVPNGIGGVTGFCFNTTTGELIFVPDGSQVTVIGVIVTKYRKIAGVWTEIGLIERELQVSVENTNCPTSTNTTLPALKTPFNLTGGTMTTNFTGCDTVYTFGTCSGQTIQFTLPCVDGDTVGFRVSTNADSALPGSNTTFTRTAAGGWNVLFSWLPPSTATGTHFITLLLEDAACPFRTIRTYTLAIYINPATTSSPDTILCPGQTTIISAYGGSTFTWTSSSSTTPTAGTSITVTPTATTTYFVQSNLANSCKNKDTTVITVTNNTFTGSITPPFSTRCEFQYTTLTANASISSTFKYWWTCVPAGSITTSPNAQSIIVSPTSNSTYIVREEDAQGCTQVDSAVISVAGVSPDIKLSAVPPVICKGDSAQLSSFSAVPASAYCKPATLFGCSGTNNLDSLIIGGVVFGLNIGCTSNPTGYVNNGYVNSTCFSTGSTYTFTLGTSGITPWDQADYYVWIDYNHNGSFADPGEWAVVINNQGQGNGTYVNSASVTIPATAIPGKTHMRVLAIPWFDGPETDLPCDVNEENGEYVDYDINICTTGLTFTWTPSKGLSSSSVPNPKASPDSTTIYTLTAVSGGTCSNSDTVSVRVVPNYTIAISPTTDSVCNTGTETITITTNPTGNYTYTWYAGDTSATPIKGAGNPYTVTPLSSTNYYVKVTSGGGGGCVKWDSSYMKLLVMPIITSTATNKLLCFPNDTTTLSAAYADNSASRYCEGETLSGCNDGFGDITYAIDTFTFAGIIAYYNAKNPCATNNVFGYLNRGKKTATCLNAGSSYPISFGLGFTGTAGVLPTSDFNNYGVWIDLNQDGMFEPSELVYSTNNNPPYSGTITIPAGAQPGITRMRVRSMPEGTPVLATYGCDSTDIFEGEVLDWSIKICNTSFTYTWAPTTGLTNPNNITTGATVTTTTTYTVSLNGYNGFCHSNSLDTITAAVFTLSTGVTQTICPGTTTVLDGMCSPPAGVYKWTALSGNNGEIISGDSTLTPTVKPAHADTFVIVCMTVLSPTLTCTATDSVIVKVYPRVIPNPDPVDTTICYGATAKLDGGDKDDTWSWSPANNLNDTTGQVVMATNLTTTTIYTLTATDGNGCIYDTTLKVNVDPKIPASAGNDTTIVYGSSTFLHGSGGVSYVWAPNYAIQNADTATPMIDPTLTTTYTVTVTTQTGCTATSTVIIEVTSKCLGLYVPNAFTPNNDGKNDYIVALGEGLFDELTDFRVYNRWGQLVFQTNTRSTKWDGTFNGKPLDEGTYVYYIQYECDGQVTKKQGDIILLR